MLTLPEYFRKEGVNYFTVNTIQDLSGKIWYRIITVFEFLSGPKIWKEVVMKKKLSLDKNLIVMDDEGGSTIDHSATVPATKYDLQAAKHLKYEIEDDTFPKQSPSAVANLEETHDSKDLKERKASEKNFQMQFGKTVENSASRALDEKRNFEDYIKGN